VLTAEINSTKQGSPPSAPRSSGHGRAEQPTGSGGSSETLNQLRAAQDRTNELEAEIEAYRDRAERAEHWLHKVYTEMKTASCGRKGDARCPDYGAGRFLGSFLQGRVGICPKQRS
jgi:hypothetical protein